MHHPAPFLRRLVARLLDLAFSLLLAFLLVIPAVLVLLLLSPLVALFAADSAYEIGGAAAVVCYLIAYVGLEVFLLVRREGQTLGKGLMGLRVVSAADGNATPLGLPAAVARMGIVFAPFALMSAAGREGAVPALDVIATIGLLSLIASLVLAAVPSGRRRALHDMAAGSRVVRAPRRGIEWKQDARMVVPGRIDMTKHI